MAIVTKTYLSKCNTIVKDNPCNLSLNPVMELNYGKNVTRGMIFFDHNKIAKMVENKTYPDITKLKHVLHMTNAASLMQKEFNCGILDLNTGEKKDRATSFDLIFFLINKDWDNGKGYDYGKDLFEHTYRSTSNDGASWYQFRNYFKWDEDGIYSNDTLSRELDKATYSDKNESDIIIGYQHFEYGNENICFDMTCVFNKFLTGELENYGIGIAFAPSLEATERSKTQYVGFFTQHTHTFFEPYIETTYDETIEDDRNSFYLDKNNKLYFYASADGNYVCLDELPTCTINGQEMAVNEATRGVYYVNVNLSSKEYRPNTMIYDIWDNIKYDGIDFDPVELQFVTKAPEAYFKFGKPSNVSSTEIIPSLYGINQKEQVVQGEIRKINVDCRIQYTSSQLLPVDGIEYRIYTLEGDKRQHNVIDWTKLERTCDENYFVINTEDFIPARYYVDIRIKKNLETTQHLNMIEFDVVSNVTNKFE